MLDRLINRKIPLNELNEEELIVVILGSVAAKLKRVYTDLDLESDTTKKGGYTTARQARYNAFAKSKKKGSLVKDIVGQTDENYNYMEEIKILMFRSLEKMFKGSPTNKRKLLKTLENEEGRIKLAVVFHFTLAECIMEKYDELKESKILETKINAIKAYKKDLREAFATMAFDEAMEYFDEVTENYYLQCFATSEAEMERYGEEKAVMKLCDLDQADAYISQMVDDVRERLTGALRLIPVSEESVI